MGDIEVVALINYAMRDSFISMGYRWLHLYRQRLFCPLSLTHGELVANIDTPVLRPEDGLEDAVARFRRAIVAHGMYTNAAIRSLLLPRTVLCTTNIIERHHGAGACSMKLRDRIGEVQLRARSLLGPCKSVAQPMTVEKSLNKLHA